MPESAGGFTPAPAWRVADAVVIVGAALAAAAAIVSWYDRPALISTACAALGLALLARFHEPRDVAGLMVGATLGNATELACDAAGVWQHADRSILNVAPAYILLCYPILGLATPRLVEALAGGQRPRAEAEPPTARLALTLLVVFVALSMRFSREHAMQSLLSALCLALTMWRFHSRHDLIGASAGAGLALIWEVPATLAGAWSFPTPTVFGLIPAWLPVAYAVFFVTMGRLTAAATARAVVTPPRLRPGARPPGPTRHSPAPATAASLTGQTPDISRYPTGPAATHRPGQSRPPRSAPTGVDATVQAGTR